MQKALLFFVFVALSTCFVFEVGASEQECFYEYCEANSNIKLMFQVLEGGNMDIDFTITNPSGEQIYSGVKETEGKYDFRSTVAGDYRFCFVNSMSSLSAKSISVVIMAGDNKRKTNYAKAEDITPLEQAISNLIDGVADISAEQEYMSMREVAHRNINKSTNRRIIIWFFFELILIIGLAGWQVYYLKKFFEVKRVV